MNRSMPGLPVHHQLPEFTQTHIHRVGDALQPSHPLSSPSPPAPNLSQHRGFPNESTLLMRRPKYWSFSFSIDPFNEYSGLTAFRIDWLIFLQPTVLSRVFYSTIVRKHQFFCHSALFIVQLSPWYVTTRKTIVLSIWKFLGKVMSLLFNMLSRFIMAFLPRSKYLLISRLQSPSAVILKPKKIKSVTVSTFSTSICHEVMEPDAMIFVFWILCFKPAFLVSSSLSSRGSLVPLCFIFTCSSKLVSNITSFVKLSSSLFQTLT